MQLGGQPSVVFQSHPCPVRVRGILGGWLVMTRSYLCYHCVFLFVSRWWQAGGRPTVITLPCIRDSIRLKASLLCLGEVTKKPWPEGFGTEVLHTTGDQKMAISEVLTTTHCHTDEKKQGTLLLMLLNTISLQYYEKPPVYWSKHSLICLGLLWDRVHC